ncbi:hypothetical protein SAMN04487881_3475 [Marinobacter sp. es.048]|uniref:hypothetical protein n=1 Tax=Marinobacter sp. es.048 TaxID=1761795 RepID=UPI000B597E30|nr:hypothetical protein [Marinobacter sp. es.048]SNC76532.1 hypothetical protein SAMN04487881_3475 [Marinobacter sp. es.048]
MISKRTWKLLVALPCLVVFSAAVNAAEPRSMLDGDVVAAEAGMVELVTGSSGDVVQVRVEACQNCMKSSYLPARDLVVSRGGRPVSGAAIPGLSGGSGTLVIDSQSGMIEKVDFWIERGGERVAQ